MSKDRRCGGWVLSDAEGDDEGQEGDVSVSCLTRETGRTDCANRLVMSNSAGFVSFHSRLFLEESFEGEVGIPYPGMNSLTG